MHAIPPWEIATVALVFFAAGTVKGIAGMGLPAVAIGILGLLMTPGQAAGLTVIPSLASNLWQFGAGPSRRRALARIWPLLLALLIVTPFATEIIAGGHNAAAFAGLGTALLAYGTLGLMRVHFRVGPRAETWLTAPIGVATGIVAGASGLFAVPMVPYIEALGLERETLVQTIGLAFLVSSLSLGTGLAAHGALTLDQTAASALCLIPALAGMQTGRRIRFTIDRTRFRAVFLTILTLIGLDLLTRGLLGL